MKCAVKFSIIRLLPGGFKIEICFINDASHVDQLKTVSNISELQKLNDYLSKNGLDEFGCWYEVTETLTFCSNCGKVGHKKGHKWCKK